MLMTLLNDPLLPTTILKHLLRENAHSDIDTFVPTEGELEVEQ